MVYSGFADPNCRDRPLIRILEPRQSSPAEVWVGLDELPWRLAQLYPTFVVGGGPIFLLILFDDAHSWVGVNLEG